MRQMPTATKTTIRRAGAALLIMVLATTSGMAADTTEPSSRVGVGTVLAQATPDVAVMKLGERYQAPKGLIEILGLSREPKESGTQFVVNFRFITDREAFTLNPWEFVRLYSDGIPRAPHSTSTGSIGTTIPREAAQEFDATFLVPGEPREVVLQFGYPDTPRTRRRWPG